MSVDQLRRHKPDRITIRPSGSASSIEGTVLTELPPKINKYRSDEVAISLYDSRGLQAPTPHVTVGGELIGGEVSVLIRGGKGIIPLEGQELVVNVGNAQTGRNRWDKDNAMDSVNGPITRATRTRLGDGINFGPYYSEVDGVRTLLREI